MADEKVDTGAELARAQAEMEKAKAADDAAKQEALDNRTPEQLIGAWIEAVTMRLGNRPELRAIVNKLNPPAETKEAK